MRAVSARKFGRFHEERERAAGAGREVGLLFASFGRIGAIESEESDMERFEGEEYFGERREATRENKQGDENSNRVYGLGNCCGVAENGEEENDVARTRDRWIHRSRNERNGYDYQVDMWAFLLWAASMCLTVECLVDCRLEEKLAGLQLEKKSCDERAREKSPLDFRRV